MSYDALSILSFTLLSDIVDHIGVPVGLNIDAPSFVILIKSISVDVDDEYDDETILKSPL